VSEKPKFGYISYNRTFADDIPGAFPVIRIQSDGKDFFIDISEGCIPYLTSEVIEKLQFVLTDALYRVRPDLRKQ